MMFEIVASDGKVHGPFSLKELRDAVATLGKDADDETPHRGVRVAGCEPETPH